MISFREESTKNGCRTSPVALGTGLYTSVALPSRNVPRTFPEPSCRQSRFTLSLAHSPCFAGSSDGAWRSFSPWGHGISTSGRHCPASWPSALHPFSPSFFSSVASTSSAVPLPYWKTRRLIRKLGMRPTWWNTGAGYLLIDERQGSWIINGTAGMIVDIKRLHGHSDWQMHRLDLYTTDTPKPTASYGFGSAEGDPRSCENFPKGLCPTGKKRPSRHIRGLTEKRKQSLRSALKTNPFL